MNQSIDHSKISCDPSEISESTFSGSIRAIAATCLLTVASACGGGDHSLSENKESETQGVEEEAKIEGSISLSGAYVRHVDEEIATVRSRLSDGTADRMNGQLPVEFIRVVPEGEETPIILLSFEPTPIQVGDRIDLAFIPTDSDIEIDYPGIMTGGGFTRLTRLVDGVIDSDSVKISELANSHWQN